MNNAYDMDDHGGSLGAEAVHHIVHCAGRYADHERQRIALLNEARINALSSEGRDLVKRESDLERRLRNAAPPGDARSRKGKVRYYSAIGGVLTMAGLAFALIGFAPYGLGWIGNLYCLGIALVTPFAVDEFLMAWRHETMVKSTVTMVFFAALIGGGLLAAIRGDLLARKVTQSSPAVVIDGADPSPAQPQESFYQSTETPLRLLLLFLALAIDLGAGIAFYRARSQETISGEDHEKLMRELALLQERRAEIIREITDLTNASAVFVHQFWRDFYRALITRSIQNAITKLTGLVLLICLLGPGRASAKEERQNLIVAFDLSTSEAARGADQKTKFESEIEGVARLLGMAPADSHVTIIGITSESFGKPVVLMRADVSSDEGYFGERLARARQELVRAWRDRAARLAPTARGTDLFGAFLLASELFSQAPIGGCNILVVYSDMRHVTRELDLERSHNLKIGPTLAAIKARGLVADLTSIAVYVFGASSDGMQIREWQALRQFWLSYFHKAGAHLNGYTVLADPHKLEP